MNIPIGYVITLLCALGGYALSGGHIGVLYQPTELLIIFGAGIGTMISSNNARALKMTGAAMPAVFKSPHVSKRLFLDLLCLMFEILSKIRRDGLMSMEGDIEDPETSPLFEKYPLIKHDHHLLDFITDYLRMMLGGSLNVLQLESLMEQEIEAHHQNVHLPVAIIQRMADGLPAFGIVAAVMGVVHTMGSVGLPPAELGKLIGAALVGTFLGILLAYAFVGPIASVMEQNAQIEAKTFDAVKAVLLASLNGFPPQAAIEFGRKILYADMRPTFVELDEETKALKGK